MNTFTERIKKHAGKSNANRTTGSSKNTFQFADDRPENLQLRRMQEIISNSVQSQQQRALQQRTSTAPVTQLIVQVGTDIYKAYDKRKHSAKDLISLIESNMGTLELRYDWKARIKEYVNDDDIVPRAFTDLNDLLGFLTKSNSTKKTQSEKNREQDLRIQGLNTGYGPTELQYGKYLSYESQKAFGNFTQQIKTKKEYTDTKMELEDIDPGIRSTTNDFTKSNHPFIHLQALGESNLNRLDFMGPNDVEIDTQGYSSMKDRSVDPHTLNTSFGYGTVKIGPDISSYKKEMDSISKPDQHQMEYLNYLEMHRFPQLSPQTGIKRELYDQGKFTKDQGMGFNHNHSSVEFIGAISGSSMTNQQRDNMRQQQTYSNYAILETAYKICPDQELGNALSNGKHVPTSREEMDALNHFIKIVKNPMSTQKEKDEAKHALRRVLMQVLRSVTQIEDIDSEDDFKYPTSPYNPNNY